jgi:SagB-type dehydrogenase family enzyme
MAAVIRKSALFRPPVRPCLLRGLVVVPVEGGVLIEGAEQRQVFRGAAVSTLLPRLFSLLDGTRTSSEVAAALPDIPVLAIENALALLYMSGLLQDGNAGINVPDIMRPIAGFIERHVDVTRVNRSTAEALARLQSVSVAAVGVPEQVAMLRVELERCGMTLGQVEEASLAVALVHGEEDELALTELEKRLAARRVPWLRSALIGSHMELGPYFSFPGARCYRCFTKLPKRESTSQNEVTSNSAQAFLKLWITLTATELIFLSSHICPPVTGQSMLVFNLANWSQHRMWPPRLPGCQVCCPNSGSSDIVEPAVTYEQAVESPPSPLLYPKQHQLHHLRIYRELQESRRRFPSFRLQSLGDDQSPAGGFLASLGTRHGITPIDRPALAGILRRTTGFRDAGPRLKRWVPSAGNLGSVQVYLVALRINGLLSGLYAYAARQDALVSLEAEGPQANLQALAEIVGDKTASALLVLTADLPRVFSKYGPTGYHLIHLDAGAALAQCTAVAAGYGLTAYPALKWDDKLFSEALLLDSDIEPITAIVLIGGERP